MWPPFLFPHLSGGVMDEYGRKTKKGDKKNPYPFDKKKGK